MSKKIKDLLNERKWKIERKINKLPGKSNPYNKNEKKI